MLTIFILGMNVSNNPATETKEVDPADWIAIYYAILILQYHNGNWNINIFLDNNVEFNIYFWTNSI